MYVRGRRLEGAADIEGWWRSVDWGLDQVVKRYAIDDFSEERYRTWLERIVPSDEPPVEIRPLSWLAGFWEIGDWWCDLRPGV